MQGFIVKQTWVFCTVLGVLLGSCSHTLEEKPFTFSGAETRLFPHVEGVQGGREGIRIRFSLAMDPGLGEGAVRFYRLNAHAYADLELAGTPEPPQKMLWEDERTLLLNPPPAPGVYVLFLTGLRSRGGEPLDGMYGKGTPAGYHRLDEDWLEAPAPYRSLPFPIGEPEALWYSWGSSPYLKLRELVALYSPGGSGLRSQDPETLYTEGSSRVARLPPRSNLVSFRLEFTSPAGFPYNLPSPLSLLDEIKILRADGSEIPVRLDLSGDPQVVWVKNTPSQIVAVTGMTLFADAAPPQPLGNFRAPQEPVYLLLGNAPPPQGILTRLLNYEPSRYAYTVTAEPLFVEGTITGNTLVTAQPLLEGSVGPGWLLFAYGASYPVLSFHFRTAILGGTPPQGSCQGCFFLLADLSPRIAPGTPLFFTSNLWYLHLRFPPGPERVPLFLIVNDNGNLRNLMGAPFRDEERDGDEARNPPVPDDRFVLAFSFRSSPSLILTATRVNDGQFYPPAHSSASFPCAGDAALPVCVLEVPDPFCPGRTVKGKLLFSFATADGDARNPMGYTDLVDLDSLTPQRFTLSDALGNPLPIELNTETIFSPTPYGVFPTHLIVVTMRALADNGCSRGFYPLDRLRVDHRIRFLVPEEPRTLDGNGDGVASPDPEDDWIATYDPEAQSFLPLPRYPRRPP